MLDALTKCQAKAYHKATELLASTSEDRFLVIKGSAGTGKTTLVKAICDYAKDKNYKLALSAPTGKAAKVLGGKTQQEAKTIHSMIYNLEDMQETGSIKMRLKEVSKEAATLYIVDEASMISDQLNDNERFILSNSLLNDLLAFVFAGHPANRIIFVGDSYQLPPVKSNESPALSAHFLREIKMLNGKSVEMHEVVRQQSDSYILKSAVEIREALLNDERYGYPHWKMLRNRGEAISLYLDHYRQGEFGKVAFVAFTNQSVNELNAIVRDKLDLPPFSLAVGDHVVVSANWVSKDTMLMNGEMGIILDLEDEAEIVEDVRFVQAKIGFTNPNGKRFEVDTRINLDTLLSPKGEMDFDKQRRLYLFSISKKGKNGPMDDPYLRALRVRFGHAITCHKAQGSEWENVIVHPYYPREDLRWLYTAVTRAKQELYSFWR